MKAIKQIVIILAAALVVTGITYALGHSTAAQEMLELGNFPGEGRRPGGFAAGELPEGFEFRQPPDGEFSPGAFPRGESGRGGFGEHSANPFSTAGLLTFARTLIPMTIVIAIVVLLSKGIRAVQRRRV